MKQRPILMSGPMVRAILAGTKTQTRRIVKGNPADVFPMKGRDNLPNGEFFISRPDFERVGNSGQLCPHGQPGDQLWVRETFTLEWPEMDRPEDEEEFRRWVVPHYAATGSKPDLVDQNTGKPIGWTPSIYMPRWASRITLEITEVRVQRLQDISVKDCMAEGAYQGDFDSGPVSYESSFRDLWESINGAGSWESNPWVWALSFKRASP